jgi:hypothetical protein
MQMFVIRLGSGEYVTDYRIWSSYLDYKTTIHRAAASELNAFDSQFVLKRLKNLGQKNTTRPKTSAFRSGEKLVGERN